ncbi:MAG: WbqC family protein, partial [Candidatus Sericytochromatia bacterium]|nr:WbqC family protein [Candidatus Tanganyikabacteria bacterium]
AYARAPFLGRYLPPLEEILQRRWERLIDLDIACVEFMAGCFGLRRRLERASALGVAGGRNERLLNICRHFGATTYLSTDASEVYLDVPLFARDGIAVEWQRFPHPVYPQLHGAFLPYLSAIDLLLNCGDGAADVLERVR